MKRLILFAAALLCVSAASAQGEYNFRKRSLFDVLPIRANDIVFLGNSITDGCEWAELFDNRHVKNRGISGDRSGWMLERLDPIVKGRPKKLFLMIGTNDLSAGRTPEQIAGDIAKIVARFRDGSPRTKIYVQSILPVNGQLTDEKRRDFYERKNGMIVETNRLIEQVCGEMQVPYVDLYSAMVDGEGRLDKRYSGDGLHLRGAGYLVWKSVVAPYVK